MAKRKVKEASTIKVDEIPIGQNDERFHGREPSWVGKGVFSSSDPALITSYNWYSYVLDEKDAIKILSKRRNAPDEARAFNALKASEIPNTLVALIRMQIRGLELDKASSEKLESRLDELITTGKTRIGVIKRPTVSVQSRAVQSAGRYIADLEDQLDILYKSNYKSEFKCYDWLSKEQVGPMVAKEIAAYYQPILDEIKLAVAKTDKDCTQGYATHSKAGMLRYIAWLQSVIDDCETWSSNKRKQTVRKPRAKKAVTAAKQVDKIKFQREDTDLKLVSIDPTKLVGASELWLYNTKYRTLQHYVAVDRGGFAVKGTTLQNFNETLSEMKKIRKPEIVSSFVVDGPKVNQKHFKNLKVKSTSCNGRLNEFTLILRAIK